MSKTIFTADRPSSGSLHVASYCGPANTLERTRMRLQIEAPSTIASLGYNDVLALYDAIGRWLNDLREKSAES